MLEQEIKNDLFDKWLFGWTNHIAGNIRKLDPEMIDYHIAIRDRLEWMIKSIFSSEPIPNPEGGYEDSPSLIEFLNRGKGQTAEKDCASPLSQCTHEPFDDRHIYRKSPQTQVRLLHRTKRIPDQILIPNDWEDLWIRFLCPEWVQQTSSDWICISPKICASDVVDGNTKLNLSNIDLSGYPRALRLRLDIHQNFEESHA